jgi:hypothetical protein
MKILLGNLLLVIISFGLAFVLLPFSLIYSIFKTKKDIKTLISDAFFKFALGIDQMGNAVCYLLFNDLFIVDKTLAPFGNVDETISSVLGKNKLLNNLSVTGKILDGILNLIDYNHTIKSIEK